MAFFWLDIFISRLRLCSCCGYINIIFFCLQFHLIHICVRYVNESYYFFLYILNWLLLSTQSLRTPSEKKRVSKTFLIIFFDDWLESKDYNMFILIKYVFNFWCVDIKFSDTFVPSFVWVCSYSCFSYVHNNNAINFVYRYIILQ